MSCSALPFRARTRLDPSRALRAALVIVGGFGVTGVLHAGALPDMVVTSVSMSPAQPVAGQLVTFSAQVRNQGSGPTPAGVYNAVAFLVDGREYSWGGVTASLPPGGTATITANTGVNYTSTWTAVAGGHTVLAHVNDVGRFPESNTGNNTLSKTFTVASVMPTINTLFGATSWLHAKLPANPRLYAGIGGATGAQQAAALVSALGNALGSLQVVGEIGQNAWPSDASCTANPNSSPECHDWGHPVYFAPAPGAANERVYHIAGCVGRLSYGMDCDVDGMTVRMPANAQQSGASDHEMAVVDTVSGLEYALSGVNLVQDAGGNWAVQPLPPSGGDILVWWGGYAPLDGANTNNPWIGSPNAPGLTHFSGITASHLALSAAQPDFSEITAGVIDHPLFVTLPCSSGHTVYPAAGSDGPCSAVAPGDPRYPIARALMSAPPDFGIRIKLMMTSAEIDALGVTPYVRMLLHAWADYGLVMGDTGGTGWNIAGGQPSVQYTSQGLHNPWLPWMQAAGAAWNGWSWNLPLSLGGLDLSNRLAIVDPCYSVPVGQTVTDAEGHVWTSCR